MLRAFIPFGLTVIGVDLLIPSLVYGKGPLDGLDKLRAGYTMRASSSDPDWEKGNADSRSISPGETLVIADLDGPGRINHIWNTISAVERGAPRLVVIRMYWDDEDQPSVEVPLGDFFVIGHGIDRSMQSLPVVVTSEGRARNCYWPMPFGKSAKITITNEGSKPVRAFYFYVDWQKLPELSKDTVYFHAVYRQEYPAVSGKNYLIADIEGRGHYVGTVMNVRQRTGRWYGEGDDFFFIDGESEPSLRGTGSEDYFGDAWGFRQFDGLYYGVPVWGDYDPMGLITAYRWHLPDPVTFRKSLRVEMEHKGQTLNEDRTIRSGFAERLDDFSSVAFWYQVEPHKPFPPLPTAYRRLYFDHRMMIEAEEVIEQLKATVGKISRQKGAPWSNGAQVFWHPRSKGQTLKMPLPVEEAGLYDLVLLLSHSDNYGICQVELDGQSLGRPANLYAPDVKVREHVFGDVVLGAGEHTLTFHIVGKAAESTGYNLGVDGVVAERRN